ncbi:MAG: hypothetical protein AAB468_01495 [Patescibacteria group bacterium]
MTIDTDTKIDLLTHTVSNLADVVEKGFTSTDKKIDDLAMATKKGFDAVDEQFEEVNKHFESVENRLDRIEGNLLRGHDNRLERLEDFMRQTKTALHLK